MHRSIFLCGGSLCCSIKLHCARRFRTLTRTSVFLSISLLTRAASDSATCTQVKGVLVAMKPVALALVLAYDCNNQEDRTHRHYTCKLELQSGPTKPTDY